MLELAEDENVPLLERVKFCAIVSSNLDEFFMVRVAGLHDQIEAGIETPLQDGRTPSATLDEIRRIVREHIERQSRCLELDLRPALADQGIRIVGVDDVGRGARARSTSASGARSSRCSRRWPSGSAGPSRTSPTCRCRSACWSATRSPASRRSRA